MAIEVSRRQLLASAGGMVLASFALPPNLRKAVENVPASLLGKRSTQPVPEIKHVVVLMQENRSFDHYFGAMPGVRGFADPGVPKTRFYQYDADNPDKYLLPSTLTRTAPARRTCPPTATAGVPSTSRGTTGRWTGS